MLSKEQVRKKYFLIRKKKYFNVKNVFFKPLFSIIKKKKIKKISLYYPSNHEVNTLGLFSILSSKKNLSILLPKILKNEEMKLVKYKFLDPLEVNKFGFLEPKINSKSEIPDLMIVPTLVFDKDHNRLGYGKGYYDKFLSKYVKNKKNILTIGLAFSFQKYKKLPTSKLDVKLDYILTERGIF